MSTSELVPDELWAIIQPLLPPPKRRRKRHAGRKPVEDRIALTVIVFVLKTGLPWRLVPRELGCSGVTAWRRLTRWQRLGVWRRVHAELLAVMRATGVLDLSWAALDSASSRALCRGEQTGPSPVDRGKYGSKHHVLTEAQGAPLASRVTAANVADVTQAMALVEAIPPIKGQVGHPRFRPPLLFGDRAYDSDPLRAALRAVGITPKLARRGTAHGSGFGRYRGVVERALAWKHDHRRLLIRTDRRADVHAAFNTLSDVLVCWHIFKHATSF